jgi:hypothetical protein
VIYLFNTYTRTTARTSTVINNSTAIVVWLRRDRVRRAWYIETGEGGAIAIGVDDWVGSAASDESPCGESRTVTGWAGLTGDSAIGITIDGLADGVAAGVCCGAAIAFDEVTDGAGVSATVGIKTFTPQAGQIPRFPAKCSLTLS